jgi:hypothetical protein|tara:strand:- start:21643 stop:22161 length:519 start_codon:yes stop_codon:yes gene_type:complete
MQIKDIILEDDETMTLGDVQILYGDDPKMMKAIQYAYQLPKIKTWDQAIDKASAVMQQQRRRDARKPDKVDREFGTANMKLNQPKGKKADPNAPAKTRGAQLGNQNAFKGGSSIAQGIKKAYTSIRDFGKDGYVSGVKDAMSSGGDLTKAVTDRYTKMARTPNKAPKDTFNS